MSVILAFLSTSSSYIDWHCCRCMGYGKHKISVQCKIVKYNAAHNVFRPRNRYFWSWKVFLATWGNVTFADGPASYDGPLARYAKLRVAHAPGMPGTFSPTLLVRDPDMHNGTCVTHVPWCMSGLLTSGFIWSRWRGKRSRHSWRMRNPQFCVSGKRPMQCH